MGKETVSINVRIDKDLKDRFIKVADANDDTASQLLRKYIKSYLSEHSQGKLL